jgi:hypothetical protein
VEKAVEDGTKEVIKKLPMVAAIAGATLSLTVAKDLYATAPAIAAFLLTNQAILCDFALLAGADLSWLPPFLYWLKRQQHRLNG